MMSSARNRPTDLPLQAAAGHWDPQCSKTCRASLTNAGLTTDFRQRVNLPNGAIFDVRPDLEFVIIITLTNGGFSW
jgi:hypothetical protein